MNIPIIVVIIVAANSADAIAGLGAFRVIAAKKMVFKVINTTYLKIVLSL